MTLRISQPITMPITSAATNQPSPFISVYGIVDPPRGLWSGRPGSSSWGARSGEMQLARHEQVVHDVDDPVPGTQIGFGDRNALAP